MEKRKLGKNGDSLMTASAAVAVGEKKKNLTKFRTSTAVPLGFRGENMFYCRVSSLKGNSIISQLRFIDISKVSLGFCANLRQKPDRK